MNPTERYTDALLDAKFETMQGELRALRDIPLAVGGVKGDLKRVEEDVDGFHEALRNLEKRFTESLQRVDKRLEDFKAEYRNDRKDDTRERQSGRRWAWATGLTVIGLLLTTVGMLLTRLPA